MQKNVNFIFCSYQFKDNEHFALFTAFLLFPYLVIVGVLKAQFVQPLLDPDFYSGITEEIDNDWKTKHNGKNVSESIKEYLVTNIGEPLNQLLRYSGI